MNSELTYEQIFGVLFSPEIEEYVPDGISVSHPIINIVDGRIVDCFLLYSSSSDKTKYTVPSARIVVDSIQKSLVDFKTVDDMPFSVYDGTDYFTDEIDNQDLNSRNDIEKEYERLYINVRKIAFKQDITDAEKEELICFIRMLKNVEKEHLLPFLFELGESFFIWTKRVIA